MAELETASGAQALHLDRQPHWEHGYASTVHAAQGRTTDEVLIHIDSSQKSVVGRESWYVAISRARRGVEVFCDDQKRLPDAIGRVMGQVSSLESLECRQQVPAGQVVDKQQVRDPLRPPLPDSFDPGKIVEQSLERAEGRELAKEKEQGTDQQRGLSRGFGFER
jgi:hypothetical protein